METGGRPLRYRPCPLPGDALFAFNDGPFPKGGTRVDGIPRFPEDLEPKAQFMACFRQRVSQTRLRDSVSDLCGVQMLDLVDLIVQALKQLVLEPAG